MTSKIYLIFSLLIFTLAPPGAAAPVTTYDELVHAIRNAQAASQSRVEQAVEHEKVREAWEIGKLIDGHVLQHKERADYGAYVIERLAGDLAMDRTELYRMLAFARAYPIVVPGQQLSWSHYKALLPIANPKKRDEIAEKAVREAWDRDRLRQEIQRQGLSGDFNGPASVSEPLKAEKGVLDTYRIVLLENHPVISLGFSNFLKLSGKDAQRFKEGDLVHVSDGKMKLVKGATESLVPFQLFSYRAKVIDVTDGDTFWAFVDLGFGIITKQQLRLRGLDAPEIESAEGKEAKAFLESVLMRPAKPGEAIPSPVIITATKSDKYDRYLVDVWAGGTFLNQQLLDKGLAVRESE